MTTSPVQLELYIKLNGGAPLTGVVTAAYADSVVLSVGNTGTGAKRVKYRIRAFPPGFTVPAGWTAEGKFYVATVQSGADAPAFTLPTALSALWGKFIFDATRDGQLFNGRIVGEYIAKARLKIPSVSGVDTIAYLEDDEFDATIGWTKHLDSLARRYEEGMPGAGDVSGDTASVSGNFARMHGVGGKAIRDAGVGLAHIGQGANVKHTDFGAVGNGIANDSVAIQDAIDATPAGQDVYVPDGTYIVENLTLGSGKRLTGTGILKYKANSAVPMLTISGVGTRVYGLKFDGNRANQTLNVSAILTSAADGAQFENCDFYEFRSRCIQSDVASSPNGLVKNCNFYDLGTTGVICDAVVIRSPSWTVSDCWFEDIDDGHCVRLGLFGGDPTTTPVTGSVVKGCHFLHTNHNGVTCEIYTQGAVISGCEFLDVDQAIKCEAAGGTVWGIDFNHNICTGIKLGTAFNLGVGGNYSDNQIYASAGGLSFDGPDDIICKGNYIEATAENASGASSIEVGSGYTGKVTIEGNTIRSSPRRGITCNATAGGQTVRGNTVINCVERGIAVSGPGNIVEGNIVDGADIGIFLASSFASSTCRGNRVANIATTPFSYSNSVAGYDDCRIGDNIGFASVVWVRAIASGVMTHPLSQGVIQVGTEGGAATDDLDTITPATGIQIGHVIVLRSNSNAQDPTVKHGTGNIHLVGAADFAMLNTLYKIALQWSGTFWQELWRSTT